MTGKLKYYLNTWLGLVCAAGRLRTEGILAGGGIRPNSSNFLDSDELSCFLDSAELTDWRRKPIWWPEFLDPGLKTDMICKLDFILIPIISIESPFSAYLIHNGTLKSLFDYK